MSFDDRHKAQKIIYDISTKMFGLDMPCGDGWCIYGHHGGQHTNGGCRCVNPTKLESVHAGYARMRRITQALAESLVHALEGKSDNAEV